MTAVKDDALPRRDGKVWGAKRFPPPRSGKGESWEVVDGGGAPFGSAVPSEMTVGDGSKVRTDAKAMRGNDDRLRV